MSAVQYIPQNNFSSNILGFRQRHQALRGAEFEVINGIHTLVLLSDRKVKMFCLLRFKTQQRFEQVQEFFYRYFMNQIKLVEAW